MGVPKFFRYISERYPCLSELVKEYQIPDFDNLYLDMNGIIHTCSHPDDYDPHFRISEEQIFKDIFHYIEVLFRMIKPQKLFFMAVDGVAPRAKMNQQRGRRFRSARESQKLEAKAMQRGESLPEAARFDSNCITPGTEFMAKLQQQLKYFVVTKITTDKLWRKCQIVLSGPETPGEGEHKIMDYIRYMRAQPGYDPNTRHCLYGLDADLIMLGLCTHEPHFSLLREEVRFGKKNNRRKTIPEQITFYLLHLSLMREYLELEFKSVKDRLSFRYDIESIIDDWVLMGFLVGNDFIPHLPNLHIANGALPMLYNAYMKVLPELDGYINEGGLLNLERFEKFMEALRNIDMDHFSEHYADLKYFEEKTGRKWGQKGKKLEAWQSEVPEENLISLEPEPPRKPMSSELEALINKTNEMFLEPSEENLKDLATNEDVDDDDRMINYLESDCDSTDGTEDGLLDAEFQQHKKDYYMNKLDYPQVTPEVLRAQAEGYVTAIQWNLNYYYNGVCSWSWYYPHHYAPFISDIKDFKNYKFHFELGEPFKPYEQLLAVLPSASKSLLPECYWNLMTEDTSHIKEYYPVDFNTDLNGKKQDWEAVVLIPFIDEKNLLEAMEPCNQLLTAEEVKRNTHGPMLIYSYTDANGGLYEAPEYFPTVPNHHAQWRLISRDEIMVDIVDLVKGAYPGAKMDVYFPGFPTMKHLKYSSRLEKAKVKVFDQPSRNESMILSLQSSASEVIEAIATNMLGMDVYVGWPHLVEAIVVAVSSRNFKYNKAGNDGEYNVEENKGNAFDLEKHAIAEYYRDRMGVDVGDIDILIHVKVMTGRKYIFTPQGRVNLEKQWADVNSAYPLQTVVKDIKVYCEKYKMYKNIEEVFPIGSTCYMIGHPHYGCLATVLDSKESLKKGRVKVRIKYKATDPDFDKVREMEDMIRVNYMPLHIAAGKLKISRHVLSRVTGCLLVTLGSKEDAYNHQDASRVNIGLDLKYNKKNEEIPGYTRKDGREWLYSQKTVELVKEFMTLYPRLFEYLSYNSNEDVFYESELFPEDEGSGDTIKEIQKWLKKRPTASIERQACGTLVLEPDVVQLIEKITSDYDAEEEKESVVMQVKPHLLFRPDIQIGHMAPDAAATYRLYDRVVNIRESYTVPLGYTGTVIAIHQPGSGKVEDTMYDVLFDKPFAGGVALNCSPNRGYRMSNFSLINKSHGRRKVENKVGTPGLLRQQLTGMNQPTMKQIIQQSQQQQKSNGNQQGSAFASWNNGPPPPQNRNDPQNFYMPQQSYNYQQPKSINNYAFPQTAPVSLPSKRFDFMPNFAPKIPSTSGEQFAKQASYKNEDADALKKLLKIGEPGDFGGSPPRIKPAAASSGATKDSNSVTVQDLFAHAKANPPQPEKPPTSQPPQKTSCSLELLLYFQSEGLGCPHYKYFNLPGQNQYRAELMIPSSGELLLGDPASTKEEACENVARIMLQTLKNKQTATVNTGMPVNFPNPPKQWWEPGNSQQETKRWPGSENVRPNQSSFQGGGQDLQKEYSLLEREKPTKPLRQKQAEAVPFVPLQAVKQQRVAKPGSSNPSTAANKSRNSNGSEPTRQPKQGGSPKTNASANEPAENANAPKPRRKREMRIAANFHFNPKLA